VREKGALLRIAGRVGGDWTPDPGGKLPGRGIWLCRTIECIEGFRKRLRTPKGGARWKMGDRGAELAERLGEFLPQAQHEKNTGCVDGEDPDS
jgi:predicted RNA-binding protein YlxR (DUF448 family)